MVRSVHQGDRAKSIKMHTKAMSSSHHIGHIIIIIVFMICELTLIDLVLTAASIDRSNSNTSHNQKDLQQDHNRHHASRWRNHRDDQEGPLPQIVVKPQLLVYSELFAEENDPLFKLNCPIEDSITRRPEASSYTDNLIKKKLRLVKDKIKVEWFKNNEPFRARPNGNRLDKLDETTLVMYQFGESDQGHYKCLIDYSKVSPELSKFFEFSAGAEFDVFLRESLPDLRPIITHPPSHIIASTGDNVTFTCNRTDTLSSLRTQWFKSCPFKNLTCINRFMKAYNRSVLEENDGPLTEFAISNSDQDLLSVDNVTEDKTGYYGCAVVNSNGMDIRLGRLVLMDEWAKQRMDLKVQPWQQSTAVDSVQWISIIMIIVVLAAFTIGFVCLYYKRWIRKDKKQTAPLINPAIVKDSQGNDINSRRRLPNMEVPDIYNTGKSIDGFITGHFHQDTGHLMAQSICSNLLDKATPSISSANSQQSDEASSSWGKSSTDNCKVFYTPASNTTATTVPLYDHPPSTGTLGHCNTFVRGSCINNPTYGFLRPENDATDWAFPRRNLDRLDKIGEGQFGEVWRYVARRRDGFEDIVAVKQLKNRAGLGDRERLELIAEIEIMKSVNNHPNVIKLLHYCVDECGPTLLIMEYAEKGKLQTYLRKCREPRKSYACSTDYKPKPNITSKELIKFTYHIAKGMEYVASQGIVHRDLASRNILVSEDRVCKVADFGFARRVNDECAYERTTTNPVPVKWMAPEALVGNKFTSKSDVFSLGILMWEIVTLGATPYEQLTSENVYKKVTTGGRLERPPHCKDEFYNLMARCWLHDSVQRPTFKEVACELEKLLLSENDYIELDQYPEHAYYNILNTAEKEVVNLET